jgi:hypothetical protein
MTTSNRAISFLLAASLATAPVWSRPAHAEPTAADMETARDLFKEAKKLRDAGDLKGALEKFKAAHALAGTPITGVELGKTYAANGQLVEARETFLEVVRMPPAAKESDNAKAARAEAAKLEAEIAARIPSITVKLSGVPDGATATVTIDGAVIPAAAIGQPRKVNPGKHVIAAKIGDGNASTIEVTVAEKETKDAPLTVEAPTTTTSTTATTSGTTSTATTSATTSSTATPTPATSEGTHLSPWFWVGVALTGAGVVTGAITGLVSTSKASSVKSQCNDVHCPPTAQSDIDGAKATGTISTISFVVAGVGAGVAIVAFVTGSSSGGENKVSASPRVNFAIGPGSLAVAGSF